MRIIGNGVDIVENQRIKKAIIQKSISNFGAVLILENLEQSVEIINFIAPEHLHLQSKNSKKIFYSFCNYK